MKQMTMLMQIENETFSLRSTTIQITLIRLKSVARNGESGGARNQRVTKRSMQSNQV